MTDKKELKELLEKNEQKIKQLQDELNEVREQVKNNCRYAGFPFSLAKKRGSQ